MEQEKKTALVLGATGLVGNWLVQSLLASEDFHKIKVFARNSTGISDERIEEHLGDLLQLHDFEPYFNGDVVYCCIGTTRKRTPDKDRYREIDYGIPVNAALLAKQKSIPTFITVSSMGSDANSPFFYTRLKGEMETRISEIGIDRTYFLQPSLISGKRKEKRPMEWIFKQLMSILNLVMVGPLDKYRSIHPEQIAKCMVWLAKNDYGDRRIPSGAIRKIAARID